MGHADRLARFIEGGWVLMSQGDIASLPQVLDLPTAAQLLGVGRSCAYELVRRGEWPTPVLRLGKLIRIPKAPLLALIGIEQDAK